jgi:hypothetical protein
MWGEVALCLQIYWLNLSDSKHPEFVLKSIMDKGQNVKTHLEKAFSIYSPH